MILPVNSGWAVLEEDYLNRRKRLLLRKIDLPFERKLQIEVAADAFGDSTLQVYDNSQVTMKIVSADWQEVWGDAYQLTFQGLDYFDGLRMESAL